MILCDLPYGITQNKWDSVIPLDSLWKEYNRIIKDNGAIVLTASTPFDKVLGVSNIKNCLLYTSDAADDLLCVDLGGRRIIKKKKN